MLSEPTYTLTISRPDCAGKRAAFDAVERIFAEAGGDLLVLAQALKYQLEDPVLLNAYRTAVFR